MDIAQHTKQPIRALLVEDSEDDAALVVRELRAAGYEPAFERVDTLDAMTEALERPWDVILSDYSMPRFSAPEAFALTKQLGLEIPFIIVSGTVGEETAVDAMRTGVHDYLLKDKLARLGPAIARALRDVAVRAEGKRLHEQLLVSDRMASMGMLAAGVAHEINNPLAALMATNDFVTEFLSELAEKIPEARESLKELDGPMRDAWDAASRIRDIVRDVSLFSRAEEQRSVPLDVHVLLDSSIRLASSQLRNRVRLRKVYGDVPLANTNGPRLGQVFLNLLVNAAHAIPESSERNTVRVTTRTDKAGRVVIEIEDTGCGISKESLARVFDPFFTTKAAGVGTGLGLAICRRIVASLDGEITLESELGVGSVARVTLPAAEAEAPRKVTSSSAPSKSARVRVLLVDDDAMILRSMQRVLVRHHDVSADSRAKVALERIVSGKERFDVILCDLMMPEMSGFEFAAELTRQVPDQAARIVFLSGGALTPGPAADVHHRRLNKPVDTKALLDMIAEVAKQ